MAQIKVAGFVKNSFVDWPGKISFVIFLGGCNYNCYYCHNKNILSADSNNLLLDDVLGLIKEQKGFIDGVVISGGEPTVHKDLRGIIAAVHGLGLAVKLDTNGSDFELLHELVEGGAVDFVAMDIKAPFHKYKQIAGVDANTEQVKKSIEYLKQQTKVGFMFRTTPAPELDERDFAEIKKIVGSAVWKKNHFVAT